MSHRSLALTALAVAALAAVAPSCGARTSLGVESGSVDDRDPGCGDGLVDPGEACDDANLRDDDACTSSCELARCGDGIVRTGFEACDDGNTDEGDDCTSACNLGSCGNGVVEGAEACDDGNDDEGDACPTSCIAAICGDGFIHAGVEECDGGAGNDDGPAAYVVQGEVVHPIRPYESTEDIATFYAHGSASAHTGLETVHESHMFLHLQAGEALSLVTLHGIDFDSTGIEQGDGEVFQSFSQLPGGSFIAHADDNLDEFDFIDATTVVGDWVFGNNTDGGAIGGLPWPGDYAIPVETQLIVGIDSWSVLQPEGDRLDLDHTRSALVVVQTRRTDCRLDCTIPRCGDGRLDAGETCDDGNTTPGDGCSAECIGL